MSVTTSSRLGFLFLMAGVACLAAVLTVASALLWIAPAPPEPIGLETAIADTWEDPAPPPVEAEAEAAHEPEPEPEPAPVAAPEPEPRRHLFKTVNREEPRHRPRD